MLINTNTNSYIANKSWDNYHVDYKITPDIFLREYSYSNKKNTCVVTLGQFSILGRNVGVKISDWFAW